MRHLQKKDLTNIVLLISLAAIGLRLLASHLFFLSFFCVFSAETFVLLDFKYWCKFPHSSCVSHHQTGPVRKHLRRFCSFKYQFESFIRWHLIQFLVLPLRYICLFNLVQLVQVWHFHIISPLVLFLCVLWRCTSPTISFCSATSNQSIKFW